MNEDLSFPIGKYNKDKKITLEQRKQFIKEIAELPNALRQAVENLSDGQIDTPYRPEGWTVRQVIHHVGDSHMNSFIRFKLALSEDNPTIHPYAENLWAETAEYKMPVEVSLDLIDSIHQRWATLLNSMSDEDFARTINHPETGVWTLGNLLGMYVWHGKHHAAHIDNLKKRNGWN
ncbi:MAG TPA: putative metal-dependent hydrolase [Pyrinomonadaceae bacterium]|jgi:uncharacterized damage-inducible protein DinB|nr:putative metal-dependent hydrolase [Pyrinomonadaceae bacterium]